MKTKDSAIALVVIVLLLLLGAGGYLMMSKKSSSPAKTAAQTTNPTPAQTEQSLLDLLSSNKNLRCTFTVDSQSNGTSKGTVYLSGGKVRGDFTITDKTGKEMQNSMIRTGDTNYIWGSSLPEGVKMTIALDKIQQNSQASQYLNPNQKTNYKCEPWNVDQSLFNPPTNIKFTDMTSLLAPKVTGTTTQQPSTQTKSNPCGQIEDANVKAACEAALQKAGQ